MTPEFQHVLGTLIINIYFWKHQGGTGVGKGLVCTETSGITSMIPPTLTPTGRMQQALQAGSVTSSSRFQPEPPNSCKNGAALGQGWEL